MRQIIADIENLPVDRQTLLLQLASDTSSDRAAADKALTQWLVGYGWSTQQLHELYPQSGRFLDEVFHDHRPSGLPYVVRTAAADALRCILTFQVPLPAVSPGIVRILQEPVAEAVYNGVLPALSQAP